MSKSYIDSKILDLDLHMISSMQQYLESNFQFPHQKEEHLQKRKVIINTNKA